MRRGQVSVRGTTHARLKAAAQKLGVPIAQIVAQAIEPELYGDEQPPPVQRPGRKPGQKAATSTGGSWARGRRRIPLTTQP
jgi:hypothetical protein